MKKLAICVLLFTLAPHSHAQKPKYGPDAVPLSRSHEFFRESPAPDFWALSPYYAAQENGRSCSVASSTMVVNAARSTIPEIYKSSGSAEMQLVGEKDLMNAVEKKFKDSSWKKAVGMLGKGVTLEQLRGLLEKGLKAHGFDQATVEAIHIGEANPATLEKLRSALVDNEGASADFIVANFLQGTYTGDSDVGHIAPVGAYDVKRKRVLVLDPDRQWYEPYWISDETFLKGMATRDSESGKSRGYLRIRPGAVTNAPGRP